MPPADSSGGLNRRARAVLLGYLYPLLCNLASGNISGAATEIGLAIHPWIRRDWPDRVVDASASAKSQPSSCVARFGASGSRQLSTDASRRWVTADELTKFAASRLAAYKMSEEIVVLDDLPKNMAGKTPSYAGTTYLAGPHEQVAANAGPR